VQGSVPVGSDVEPATAILSEPGAVATGFLGGEDKTRPQINTTDQIAIFPRGSEAEPQKNLGDTSERQSLSAHRAAKPLSGGKKLLAGIGIAVLLLVGGFFGYRYLNTNTKQIESIAVMPFVNESGITDNEYLSDGMTETLIKSLSNLPNLNVKPRSSVFRYKGKDTDLHTIARELNVQAILNGRVVQRGEQLTLSLELVDVQKDRVIWTEQYQRKQSDLVSLQSDIARDITSKLKSKLSGADETKLTKSDTANPEAYQSYLKGRFTGTNVMGTTSKKRSSNSKRRRTKTRTLLSPLSVSPIAMLCCLNTAARRRAKRCRKPKPTRLVRLRLTIRWAKRISRLPMSIRFLRLGRKLITDSDGELS